MTKEQLLAERLTLAHYRMVAALKVWGSRKNPTFPTNLNPGEFAMRAFASGGLIDWLNDSDQWLNEAILCGEKEMADMASDAIDYCIEKLRSLTPVVEALIADPKAARVNYKDTDQVLGTLVDCFETDDMVSAIIHHFDAVVGTEVWEHLLDRSADLTAVTYELQRLIVSKRFLGVWAYNYARHPVTGEGRYWFTEAGPWADYDAHFKKYINPILN